MSEEQDSRHPQLERLRQSRSERAEKREQQQERREQSHEKDRGVIASSASLTTRAALASLRGHSLTKIVRKSFGFGR